MTSDELDDYFDAILVYKYDGRQDGRDYMKTYDEMVAHLAIATTNSTVRLVVNVSDCKLIAAF